MNFFRRSLRLGRPLTTAAQTAPAGVEQASVAAANLKGPLDAANKAITNNPSVRYFWTVGGAIFAGGSALIYSLSAMKGEIHQVQVKMGQVEVKIHQMETKLKDELHGELGQMRGELSAMDKKLTISLSDMRRSMERSEDRLSSQIEKNQIETNKTLAQLLKKLA